MIPYLGYSQLAIIGCLWLCLMLHYTWPSRGAVSPKRPTEPVPARFTRKRTSEPKPFAGFTQRPPCEGRVDSAVARYLPWRPVMNTPGRL